MTAAATIDSSELEVFEKPHLRLFLSADIVGSTAFKQKSRNNFTTSGFPLWFAIVLEFYQVAEQNFQKHWNALDNRAPRAGPDIWGSPPELWKTIGDEVLFKKRIDHPGQAVLCMLAWIATLNDLRLTLRKHNLDVKATAWVADFPVRNNEIVLQRNVGKSVVDNDHEFFIKSNQDSLAAFHKDATPKDLLRDFIGPSIDTGFRLGGFASARKLVLSVELAYILGSEQVRGDEDKDIYSRGIYVLPKFDFKYEGRHSLKGVLGGSPYPIIWLDLDPDNPVYRAEDAVLKTPRPLASEIKALARAFLEDEELLCVPHIEGCQFDGDYSDLTSDDIKVLSKRRLSMQKIEATILGEQEAEAEIGEQDVAEEVFIELHLLDEVLRPSLKKSADPSSGAE